MALDEKKISKFLREIMNIERRFDHEMKNVKSGRLDKVREILEKFSAEELDSEDSNC